MSKDNLCKQRHNVKIPMQYAAIFKGCKNNNFYAPNFEKVGDILVSACPYVCTPNKISNWSPYTFTLV